MNNQKKPEMAEFAQRLKKLRKDKKKKQSEMAELLGCTTSHYQKIEYGEIKKRHSLDGQCCTYGSDCHRTGEYAAWYDPAADY